MNRTLLFVSLTALVGCSSINPQLKSQLDGHLVRYQGAQGPAVDSPSDVRVADWAAGQYVIVSSINDGKPTLSKMAIESVDSDGIWVKIQTLGYQEKTTHRILFAQQPRRPEDAKNVIKKIVAVQNDAEPVEYDFENPNNPMVAFMRDTMESIWSGLVVTPQTEDVTAEVVVPAGTFRGCKSYVNTMSVFGQKITYEGSLHSVVPVNGMVAGRTADGKAASELLEFGFDGGPELF